jgi:prepilin-type N-terminal cleavage/methylation domain-containing protein
VVKRETGYTLVELVVAMALFALLLFVLMSVTNEMAFHERRLKLDFLRHPQVIGVISRMRRDVADGFGRNPYGATTGSGETNAPKRLVMEILAQSGGTQVVVWDFTTPGMVERRAHNVGGLDVWRARGLPPDFTAEIGAVENPNPNGALGVRIRARDSQGLLAIDQVFFPRTTGYDASKDVPK